MARASKERKIYTFVYDFAVLGGTASAKTMKGPDGQAQKLPAGARVVGSFLRGVTNFATATTANVKLGITGNDDAFKANTAHDNAAYLAGAYTKAEAEVPLIVGGSAAAVLLTPSAALTAGKVEIDVEVLV